MNSKIEITSAESLGTYDEEIITIDRKVFFLSYTEIGERGSRTTPREGEPLSYFSDYESRTAFLKNGDKSPWWLRTADTAEHDAVCGITREGWIGVGGVYGPGESYKSGARPAFCMKGDTEVCREGGGYIISLE